MKRLLILAGDAVDTIVVVAELRVVALDLEVDGHALLVTHRPHFRMLDGRQRIGRHRQPGDPGTLVDNTNALNNGDSLSPAKTEQVEFGVRKNWYDGLVTSTASVYRIYRPSAYLDPATRIFGYGGEERNSGLELNTYANLLGKTLRSPPTSRKFAG